MSYNFFLKQQYCMIDKIKFYRITCKNAFDCAEKEIFVKHKKYFMLCIVIKRILCIFAS